MSDALSLYRMVLILGSPLEAGVGLSHVRRTVPATLPDAAGRLPVRRLVRLARRAPRPTLVLTDLELAAPALAGLFAFTDFQARVVVASTFRLAAAGEPARTARRLRNVLAHEAGHLVGLGHCATPGCLMQPARAPAEVDVRSDRPCGACPPLRQSLLEPVRRVFRTS